MIKYTLHFNYENERPCRDFYNAIWWLNQYVRRPDFFRCEIRQTTGATFSQKITVVYRVIAG